MKGCVPFSGVAAVLVMATMVVTMSLSANAQISTPCNASMISSVTPCMNFLTNSSGNGTSPTADCCNSLRSLTTNGMDCLCLIVTGNVPFRIPINRTVAISLPRACNLPGVPVQCKISGAPLPAPGPFSLGPAPSPWLATSPSPAASAVPEPIAPSQSPQSDVALPMTPPSPTLDPEAPKGTTGITPSVLNPSSAVSSSYSLASFLLVVFPGTVLLNYYH